MNASSSKTPNIQQTLLNNQYELGDYIASGAFGKFYKGYDVQSQRPVALKEDMSGKSWMLFDEFTIYHNLGEMHGFLKKYGYFCTTENKKYLVLSLIDRDLETIMDAQPGQRLDLKSTLMIGIQTIERLEALHKKGYVHRDIKPENIGIGFGDEASLIYLLDLGNCAEYLTPKKREHVKLKKTKSSQLIGSVRYASLNSHEGLELSRRDDVESLVYSLIFLIRGGLPWEGEEFNSDTLRSRQDKVKDKKSKLSPEELCHGLDPVFAQLLKYARGLEYKAEPDYAQMTSLLLKAMERNGLLNDDVFTWNQRQQLADVQESRITNWHQNEASVSGQENHPVNRSNKGKADDKEKKEQIDTPAKKKKFEKKKEEASDTAPAKANKKKVVEEKEQLVDTASANKSSKKRKVVRSESTALRHTMELRSRATTKK